MDDSPFLTVNITKMSPRDVASISAFSRYNYNLEDTAKLSEELYYQTAIRRVMIAACRDPQTPFARWMMTRTYEGKKTAARVEWFKDQIKIALKDFGFVSQQSGQAQEEVSATNTQKELDETEPVLPANDWTSLADFEAVPGTKPPPVIRFPDGEERELRYWKRILVEVAEFLIRRGHLTKNECPVFGDLPGKAWVHFEPKHPDGNAFTRHEALSNGLYLFSTGISSGYAVYISKRLVENLGQDPSQVWLKTG